MAMFDGGGSFAFNFAGDDNLDNADAGTVDPAQTPPSKPTEFSCRLTEELAVQLDCQATFLIGLRGQGSTTTDDDAQASLGCSALASFGASQLFDRNLLSHIFEFITYQPHLLKRAYVDALETADKLCLEESLQHKIAMVKENHNNVGIAVGRFIGLSEYINRTTGPELKVMADDCCASMLRELWLNPNIQLSNRDACLDLASMAGVALGADSTRDRVVEELRSAAALSGGEAETNYMRALLANGAVEEYIDVVLHRAQRTGTSTTSTQGKGKAKGRSKRKSKRRGRGKGKGTEKHKHGDGAKEMEEQTHQLEDAGTESGATIARWVTAWSEAFEHIHSFSSRDRNAVCWDRLPRCTRAFLQACPPDVRPAAQALQNGGQRGAQDKDVDGEPDGDLNEAGGEEGNARGQIASFGLCLAVHHARLVWKEAARRGYGLDMDDAHAICESVATVSAFVLSFQGTSSTCCRAQFPLVPKAHQRTVAAACCEHYTTLLAHPAVKEVFASRASLARESLQAVRILQALQAQVSVHSDAAELMYAKAEASLAVNCAPTPPINEAKSKGKRKKAKRRRKGRK